MGIEGKHILSTRAAESNDEFESVLIGHGAFVECFPTIKITPVENHTKLDLFLNKINDYDGIFFTSANGVKYFFDRAKELKIKYEGKIYVVGEKTNTQLNKYSYNSAFMPQSYSAEAILDELNKDEITGKKFLFPRGNLSLENLRKQMEEYSLIEEVVVYNTVCPVYGTPYIDWIKDIIKAEGLDCITFFSPSSVQNFNKLIGKVDLKNTVIASIGDTTLNNAKEFGLDVTVIPDKATAENLAQAIVEFYNVTN